MTTSETRRFPIGLTIATAVSLVILCALGGWQLQRLAWKQDLLHRIDALQHAPARPLAQVLTEAAAGKDVDFTRVTADCPGIDRAPAERVYALSGGDMGARLISACEIGRAHV